MRASLLSLLLVLPLAACNRSDSAREASPTAPTSTPASGALHLVDLNAYEPVYSIDGLGRIPLGLANGLLMLSAHARTGNSASGQPAQAYVGLSMIFGAPLPAMMLEQGRTGVAYEWWFASTDPSDEPTRTGLQPEFKAALRFVGDGWGIFTDTGSGWQPLPDATFAFGEYEVSARLPLDPAWNISPPRSAYFRAVTRDDGFLASGVHENVGDVYPADLSWRKVFEY